MPHDVVRPFWSLWQSPPSAEDFEALGRQEATRLARIDPLKGGPVEQFFAWLLCVP